MRPRLSDVNLSSDSDSAGGVVWVVLRHPNVWRQFRAVGELYNHNSSRAELLSSILIGWRTTR